MAFSNASIAEESLDHVIRRMNNTIYEYLKENYGCVQTLLNTPFVRKYKDILIKDLQKRLKQLKLKCDDINETRVSFVER